MPPRRFKLDKEDSKCLVYQCSGAALVIILVTLIVTRSLTLTLIVAAGILVTLIAKSLDTRLTKLVVNHNRPSCDVPSPEEQDPEDVQDADSEQAISVRCSTPPARPVTKE